MCKLFGEEQNLYTQKNQRALSPLVTDAPASMAYHIQTSIVGAATT
jgi:hypothetical protein